jgi:anthranilate/para-aminobenzoate synthase component I
MNIGVGGAITYASNATEEFEETMLKARAFVNSFKNIFIVLILYFY